MKMTLKGQIFAVMVLVTSAATQAQQNNPGNFDEYSNGVNAYQAKGHDEPMISAHRSERLGLAAVSLRNGGLKITSVTSSSLGEFMGLEAGDVIYTAGGRTVSYLGELEAAVDAARNMLVMELKNVRTGQREFYRARIRPNRPKTDPRIGNALAILPEFDLTVELLPNGRDLLVSTVNAGGLGDQLGLKSGDILRRINGKPIQNVNDMNREIHHTFSLTYFDRNWMQEVTVTRSRSRYHPYEPFNPYDDHEEPWWFRD